MSWLDTLRFGVAKILTNGTELPWRGRINFGPEFACEDDESVYGATSVTIDHDELRRASYDATATVTLTAAAGWVEAWTIARTDLVETNLQARDLRFDVVVTDGSGSTSPRDRVELRATYTRRDAAQDTITNDDDGTTDTAADAEVEWTTRLYSAYADDPTRGEFRARLRRDGANITFEIEAPVGITRSAVVDVYLGRAR